MKYDPPNQAFTEVNEGNEEVAGTSFPSLPSVTRQDFDLALGGGTERRNFEQSLEATGRSAVGLSQEPVVVLRPRPPVPQLRVRHKSMPHYKVTLHCHGFRTDVDGVERPLGFYAPVFVDAASDIEAERIAMALLRANGNRCRLSRSLDSERIEREEVVTVSFGSSRFRRRIGFLFYLEGEGEDDNGAEPGAAPTGGPGASLHDSGSPGGRHR